MEILVTGASGNLGSLLARHLLARGHTVRLMRHRTPFPDDIATHPNARVHEADLARPETLAGPCRGVDAIVHFAGVLFMPRPERFLPTTNTEWFRNLMTAAISGNAKRVVLASFPHVEGETTPQRPATGRLDGSPESWHARTRLEEEKLLFSMTKGTGTAPVSCRVGMVYGRGILMIDAARWLARHRLLAVWRKPTWIHLIATPDFLRALEAAATKKGASGIYHIGDRGVITLQEFLDRASARWGGRRPWRLPAWMIFTAAAMVELFAMAFGTQSPLTRDFVRIGMASYYGDTTRMFDELIDTLEYPTFDTGIETL
ncbi:MAG TPA: NAD-dependent epimerase/dehydratase family protein [Spirochaetota bacterium]|nr:NAD-dependent epimerase/dehydratase family protein [Spirochaetota bacterium]HNT11463.1 NAD-dependent epimerase/dehydratase family protein [Spirochaetota bacterium]